MLPDFDRADRIGEFWGYPESRDFAELLIDCEEVRILRAVLVGITSGAAPRFLPVARMAGSPFRHTHMRNNGRPFTGIDQPALGMS